jgi:hypothetical protein
MRISFNQPAFIPWGGFFARMMNSDRMVLLDDTLLARGFTYVNRNRLKSPDGELWITVPLQKKGRGRQTIKDLELFEKDKWAKNFLLTLRHFYGKSVYFEPIYEEIQESVDSSGSSFLNLVLGLLDIIKKRFDISQEMALQSEMGVVGKGTSLLVSVSKELGAREVVLPYFSRKAIDCNQFKKEKIKIHLLRYSPQQYPQFWGDYIDKLSVLDLLLCCGTKGKAIIKKGIHLYNLE